MRRRLSSLAVAWVLGLATLTAAQIGYAQSAESELKRGLGALRAGRDLEAAEAFESSYRLQSLPVALVNLGIAYTRLGRIHQACQALEAYLRRADPVRDSRNLTAVRTELARLRAANAVITLHVTPPSAAVKIGDMITVVGDSEVVVPTGKQLFIADAPGYERYEKTLDVVPGRFMLDIVMRPLPGPQPTEANAAYPSAASGEPAAADAPLCAMHEVCLGPVLALGVPNLVGGSLQLRLGHYAGAGLGYQMLPTMSALGLGSIGGSLFTVEGRIYPFRGALFLTAGFAYQAVKATVKEGPLTAQAKVQLPAFLLGIGFMGHDGLVVGVDLGVLFPLTSRSVSLETLSGTPMDVDPSLVAQAELDARHSVEDFVDVLPVLLQLSAFRVGYLF